AMVSAIAHRGPDGEGIEKWPGALLAHRRLAIIDLSEAGHQPMLSDDGRIGVVFNGCIYNFLEIRSELEQKGHRFRSQCDTEVLMRGYQQWGIDELVPRLRGMFVFALWDDQRQTLTLVRDRLGVKPLVYAATNKSLIFASTVSALRAGGVVTEIDPKAVLEYLEFGYVTDDRAIFEGAAKLPAATILEWNNGRMSQRRYWTLPRADESSRITFDEAVEETERLLIESVRLRLYADVPIGALLSGGIDSTLVCWAMAKLNANITAFTVSTPGDPADEAPATLETARILGIPHRIVTMPRDQGGVLAQLTAAYGEPFGCQSALAMLQVSAAVKPHATVLLTGDGGDDVFLGYSFHRDYLRAQRLARALPALTGPVWRSMRPLVDRLPRLRRAKHFLDYATGGLGAVSRAHQGLPFYNSHHLLGDRLSGMQLDQRTMPLSTKSARNLMSELLDYQQRMWFVSEFLTKVDGGTMYHALEARSPFLDHKLWEFAAKLPPDLRLRGGVLKAILREIVRRRVSPDVANRKKQGFTVPVESWLAGHWSQALEGLGEDSLLERAGWIRTGSLRKTVQHTRTSGRVPTQLWFLVVLEQWLRRNAELGSSYSNMSPPPHHVPLLK
ncbi:MAG: asparagine synthase (glutamine-hydrolyzing), partial [Acidobacteriota bacterium]|nr:asparagine synthase (glutamine-hydrolyzing) [Acidobacteriota bacterium]